MWSRMKFSSLSTMLKSLISRYVTSIVKHVEEDEWKSKKIIQNWILDIKKKSQKWNYIFCKICEYQSFIIYSRQEYDIFTVKTLCEVCWRWYGQELKSKKRNQMQFIWNYKTKVFVSSTKSAYKLPPGCSIMGPASVFRAEYKTPNYITQQVCLTLGLKLSCVCLMFAQKNSLYLP